MSDADRMPAPATVGLRRDSFARLVLVVPGSEPRAGVTPVRAFPYTEPERWISFLDEDGRELYMIEDLTALAPETRALLLEELARREFAPRIREVRSISSGAEPTTWEVVTDRGPTTFVLIGEDHIRRMPPDGAVISDSHGVRYRLASLRELDAHSRKLLRRYL